MNGQTLDTEKRKTSLSWDGGNREEEQGDLAAKPTHLVAISLPALLLPAHVVLFFLDLACTVSFHPLMDLIYSRSRSCACIALICTSVALV
uniref:Uncharacterized protein n=1 Tax=Oryza brachyantha TaxID=4533 RepID=J3L7G8_ORYBR